MNGELIMQIARNLTDFERRILKKNELVLSKRVLLNDLSYAKECIAFRNHKGGGLF